LGDSFYDEVAPADFPENILRFRNQHWAEAVGLGAYSNEEWVRHFGRFEPLPDNLAKPLALRYHGHQFRIYNPDIGDGRGFLFAQLRDDQGQLLDLGTKGSGQTPYSRFGDGRLTLKGGVREILASEMLEALGADTSKSFSLIETGEKLERGDEPSPTRSAVLVRLQHSHIRIGTFQRLRFLGETENMRKLVNYCLRYYFGEGAVGENGTYRHCEESGPGPGDAAIQPAAEKETGLLRSARNDGEQDAAARLLAHVVRGGARLAASYIATGFVHGVLNSDNIAITCQSFDYGPWRWTPYWDSAFTAAYFDHAGLYAFGRQAEAIHWNLVQLATSLCAIAEAEALTPALEAFPAYYEDALCAAICARLGVKQRSAKEDIALFTALEAALSQRQVTIDRFFFDWRGGSLRGASPALARYEGEAFAPFRNAIAEYEPAISLKSDYWSDDEPCSMHIEEVEAIWARIDEADDWSALEEKIAAIRRMGEAMQANA
jgi:uncharacterized protein YdiU (UPF0061 family)